MFEAEARSGVNALTSMVGAIYSNAQAGDGQRCVLISEPEADACLALPLVTHSEGLALNRAFVLTEADLAEGKMPSPLTADLSKPASVRLSQYPSREATMNRAAIDRLLRQYVKFTATLHRSAVRRADDTGYSQPSGKVVDDHELSNMIDASLDMWLTSGRFTMAFEKDLAKLLGIGHVFTVNSGSSANLLAVSALCSHKLGKRRLQPGDEVLTLAAAFPTTVAPLVQNGLVPVFLDIDLGTYNIKVSQLEAALSDKTKAVFVAHTLGNPFALDEVLEVCERHDLWLIEDNCDALGSRYRGRYTGTFGHLATLSFYPAHHMTMGEGGAVLTNDSEIGKLVRSFRDWGRDCWCQTGHDNSCKKRFGWQLGRLPCGYDHKFVFSHLGYNFKITDWQAAIGLAQLEKLPHFIEKRKINFQSLQAVFSHLDRYFVLPRSHPEADPVWFGFPLTIRTDAGFSKVELITFLDKHGVGTRQLFAGNLLRQPAFTQNHIPMRILNSPLLFSDQLTDDHYGMLPETDMAMNGTFWLGVWPGLGPEYRERVSITLDRFLGERAGCS